MQSRFSMRALIAAMLLAVGCLPVVALAQMPGAGGGQPAGMPDARMMSGIPMPVGDMPDGTVSVRVVRGQITNVVPGQPVELVVNGASRGGTTDEGGHAQFAGVTPGASLKAVATVGGERIESQPFSMPEKGGVRMVLAAGAGPVTPGAPAVAGSVVLGGETRIVIEFDDDAMNVFYLLDVVNAAAAPVNPSRPIVFDLPADAAGATVLQGSSPQASVKGRRVTFAGPFNPGRTSAQVAYQVTVEGGNLTLEQRFPAAIDMVSVAVQKVGDLRVRSAQLAQQQDVPAEGKTYVVGNGPALPADRPLTIELSGLPHHETWPRDVALVLAVAILGVGLWASLGRSRSAEAARRGELEERRDRLFAELLRLEQDKRAGRIEADAYARRRGDLLGSLERIYGELDSGPTSARETVGSAGSHPA